MPRGSDRVPAAARSDPVGAAAAGDGRLRPGLRRHRRLGRHRVVRLPTVTISVCPSRSSRGSYRPTRWRRADRARRSRSGPRRRPGRWGPIPSDSRPGPRPPPAHRRRGRALREAVVAVDQDPPRARRRDARAGDGLRTVIVPAHARGRRLLEGGRAGRGDDVMDRVAARTSKNVSDLAGRQVAALRGVGVLPMDLVRGRILVAQTQRVARVTDRCTATPARDSATAPAAWRRRQAAGEGMVLEADSVDRHVVGGYGAAVGPVGDRRRCRGREQRAGPVAADRRRSWPPGSSRGCSRPGRLPGRSR